MMKKLENLINFEDFKSNWNDKKATKTKRTETGLDVIKENFEDIEDNVEEIIPEGLPDDVEMLDDENQIDNGYDEKVEEITEFLDNEPDDDILDEVVNILRDGLTEMEQMGFVESEVIDDLDDLHDGDWIAWCKDVIELPDFFEEGLDNVLDLIRNIETEEFGQIE